MALPLLLPSITIEYILSARILPPGEGVLSHRPFIGARPNQCQLIDTNLGLLRRGRNLFQPIPLLFAGHCYLSSIRTPYSMNRSSRHDKSGRPFSFQSLRVGSSPQSPPTLVYCPRTGSIRPPTPQKPNASGGCHACHSRPIGERSQRCPSCCVGESAEISALVLHLRPSTPYFARKYCIPE